MQNSFIEINRKLLVYVGKSKSLLYLIFAMVCIAAILGSLKPVFIGKIIDLITEAYNANFLDENLLTTYIFLFVSTTCSSALIQYVQGYFSAHFIKELIAHLRSDAFLALSRLPIPYFDKHSHGDIMSRLVNDTENVAQVLSQTIGTFLFNLVNILTITALMLYYSPLLTLLIYIFLPASLILVKVLSKKVRYYFKEKHKAYGELESVIEENIYAYETLLAYNKRQSVHEKFFDLNEKFKKFSIKSSILTSLIHPLLNVLSGITYIVVLFVGAFLLIEDRMTLGTIQIFLMYVKLLSNPLNNITSLYAQIQTAYAGAERIFALLDEEKENVYSVEKQQDIKVKGEIEFIGLNFAYEKIKKTNEEEKEFKISDITNKFDKLNKNFGQIAEERENHLNNREEKEYQLVLEDFNLSIASGEKLALVGETGSGKTSVINAFLRFYPYQSGQIKLDGKNIEDYDLTSFRKNISLVAQEPFLLSDTIKANIAYPNISHDGKTEKDKDKKLLLSAKNANADDFINKLPEKYESMLTSEGKNISLGQKQLLCLARCFMQDAPILIMDEATANVDTLTELQIQEAIFKLMKEKTCIVIAHRLSTIIKMDRIVVLSKGKIVEMGTHEELLEKKAHYYDLYTHQLQYIE